MRAFDCFGGMFKILSFILTIQVCCHENLNFKGSCCVLFLSILSTWYKGSISRDSIMEPVFVLVRNQYILEAFCWILRSWVNCSRQAIALSFVRDTKSFVNAGNTFHLIFNKHRSQRWSRKYRNVIPTQSMSLRDPITCNKVRRDYQAYTSQEDRVQLLWKENSGKDLHQLKLSQTLIGVAFWTPVVSQRAQLYKANPSASLNGPHPELSRWYKDRYCVSTSSKQSISTAVICSDCSNKIPEAGWYVNKYVRVFLMVLGTEVQD